MPELTPDQVEGSISGDEAKLYRLIWSRFMASQMADCIQDTAVSYTHLISAGKAASRRIRACSAGSVSTEASTPSTPLKVMPSLSSFFSTEQMRALSLIHI